MIKLTQIDRFFYVDGASSSSEQQLEKALTYSKKSARFMPNPEWGKVHLYDSKKKRFPIGLLQRSTDILKQYDDVQPIRLKPSIVILPQIEDIDSKLRDYQWKAIESLWKNSIGILQMPTGSGKTRTAIGFISMFTGVTCKILVLVPTIDLVTQWSKQVQPNVTVSTYQSVMNWKRDKLQSYDIVFFDECHHAAAKTIFKIGMNVKDNARVYGLSATPFLREEDNLKVEAVLGPVIFKISEQELVDRGIICRPEIHVLKVPQKYDDLSFRFLTFQEAYQDLIVDAPARNALICQQAIGRAAIGRVLILVNRVEHGEKLKELLKFMDVVFLHGSLSKKEREDINHQIIIATSIYDEGVDMPDLNSLILAGGGKSDIKTLQRVGRLLRPSVGKTHATIIEFQDEGKWMSNHSKRRLKVLSNVFGKENILYPPL
jgi:superfamily II DNA or RNA helicase